MSHDIEDQIACVTREIRMRESVYPRWVQGGKMSQSKSEHELACMRAALSTLLEVQQSRKLL